MAGDSNLPAQHHMVPQRGTASHPSLRDDHASGPNLHVVTQCHQVVDLRPLANACASQGCAINRRIRADLHVLFNHHIPNLGNLVVNPAAAGISKTISPDDRPRMHDHAIMQHTTIIDRHIRIQHTIGPDFHTRPNVNTRINDSVRPNHS